MTTEGYGSADSKELQPSGALQQQALSAKQVSFDNLDDVDFEEFCFELLSEIGFVNVDWRKGPLSGPVHQTAAATLSRTTRASTWMAINTLRSGS